MDSRLSALIDDLDTGESQREVTVVRRSVIIVSGILVRTNKAAENLKKWEDKAERFPATEEYCAE